jgi:hypothetical protein
MRTTGLPASGGPLQRSVAACLAAILELDVAGVPVPEDGHPKPFTVWRNWLSQRGLGLVPIHEPANFNWPGPWLALLRDGAGGEIGVVAFGSPPGVAWNPLGGEGTFDAVEHGYVIAPADVALWSAGAPDGPRAGAVAAILVATDAESAMLRLERAVARADRGLARDRYHDRRGTFTDVHDRGHDLTLIDAGVLGELGLTPEGARRNIVTEGIDLNALVGQRFTIGDVECFGQRLCEPCAHLERLTPGTLRPLIHKGGLRADLLSDGEIAVGDAVAMRAS